MSGKAVWINGLVLVLFAAALYAATLYPILLWLAKLEAERNTKDPTSPPTRKERRLSNLLLLSFGLHVAVFSVGCTLLVLGSIQLLIN